MKIKKPEESSCYKHLRERRESLIKESYQKNIYNKRNSTEIDKDNNFIHSKFTISIRNTIYIHKRYKLWREI